MTQNTQAAPEDTTAAALIDSPATVHFHGEDIAIRPLTVMQVIQVSRAFKQLLPALDIMGPLLGGADDALGEDALPAIVELLADYGEPLTEAVALCINKPASFVQDTDDIGGLIALIAAVIKANADFFGQRAGPHLAGLREKLPAGTGAMPSTPLSAPATH